MTPLASHPAVAAGVSWILTYLVHSTVLLGGAALLTRFALRAEGWRDAVWKAALVGGLITATAQAVVGYRPLVGRIEVATVVAPADGGSTAAALRDDDVAAPVRAEPADRAATGTSPNGGREAVASAPERELGGAREAGTGGSAGADESGPANGGRLDGVVASARARAAPLLLGLWALVASVLLLRLAVRQYRVHRLLNDRRQVDEGGLPGMLAELRRNAGLWRPVWLASSPRCPSPLALGTREICVPERFITELEPEAQRGALAHELAHIARRDPVWHLAAGVIESVFFFQPLNRLARLRLRETAEYLCDDWAVRQTGSELGLARCLAAVASWVAPGGETIPSGTMAMAEGGSPLLTRVERLLDRAPGTASPSAAARGLVAAALVLVVAGAAPAVTPSGPSGAPRVTDDRLVVDAAGESVSGSSSISSRSASSSSSSESETTRADAAEPAREPAAAMPDTVRVVRAPDPTLPFGALWSWAESAAADAGDRTFWIAYAAPSLAPAGRTVTGDSESWDMGELAGTPLRTLLGVEDDVARVAPGGSAVVLLFRMRDPRTGPVRLDRIALRSASVGMRLEAPVYWLGALAADVSFAWLRDLYDTVQGTRLPATLIDAIAVHPGPDVAGYLRGIIGDAAPDEVRAEAVEGLEWHPDDVTLALLARLAREDASEHVRHEATEALGALDHAGAAEALRDLTRSGRDDGVRREAAESLGERRTPDVAEILLEIASTETDPGVGREATESLSELSPELSVPILRRIAWEASNPTVRRQAAESLGDVRTPESLAVLDDIIERHSDEIVVFQAVEAIAEFPSELALPRLERIAREHPMRKARREALDKLTDLADRGRSPPDADRRP